jgi:hypothetical protein
MADAAVMLNLHLRSKRIWDKTGPEQNSGRGV